MSNLESMWEKTALHAFKTKLATLKYEENLVDSKKILIYPYLSLLRPGEYIRLVIEEVRKIGMGSEVHSLPYNLLCRNVGFRVYKLYAVCIKFYCIKI